MTEEQTPEQNDPSFAKQSGNGQGGEGQDRPETYETAIERLDEQAASLNALEAELVSAKEEAASFKDKYVRAVAEAENLRRRTEKEKSDLLQYGLDKFMREILPVLDSIEKALIDVKGEATVDGLKSGFELVSKQLTDALQKNGLSQVESEAVKFDPNVHQAIQRIESEDATDEMVKQVFVKGYTLNGRLIRPAMVSVEVPKTNS